MANLIALRIGVYHGAENPYELLASAGLGGAEAAPPADGDYAGMRQKADAAGVVISSFSAGFGLGDEASLERFAALLAGAGSIGTGIVFCSVKAADGVDRAAQFDRWRRLADVAAKHRVVMSVETHEPFGHNGTVACETMQALKHPNVRMNFDTANIYYYNHDADAVAELRTELKYVASVHLKDTPGGYHDHNFPVLGQGVVDFPKVFEILGARGFTGPYTMELEGPLTSGKSLEERQGAVIACMDYLRSIGVC